MIFKTGDRVRFKNTVDQKRFGASDEEWATNPKTGSVIEIPKGFGKDDKVYVKMDVEFLYNEKDLWCWLCDFEIMEAEDLEYENKG